MRHETVQPPTTSPTRTSRAHDGVHVIIHPPQAASDFRHVPRLQLGQLDRGLGESDRVSRGSFHLLLSPPGTSKGVGRRTPQSS